jgi:predicted RNA-binding Zn ribbon-like protein
MSSEQDAEPLAIEFANTRLDRSGGPLLELLADDVALVGWLCSALGRDLDGQLRPGDLGRFLALRDAVRVVARAVSDEQPEPAAEVALLNATAAAAPSWPELANGQRVERTAATAIEAALAELAASAIDLFGGAQRDQVRACGRWPRCVRFFVKNHPRREYCSPHCANRARAMRHYDRHRDEGGAA